MADTSFRPLNVIAGTDPAMPVTGVKYDPHHELIWAANENVKCTCLNVSWRNTPDCLVHRLQGMNKRPISPSEPASCAYSFPISFALLGHVAFRVTYPRTMEQDCSATLHIRPTRVPCVKWWFWIEALSQLPRTASTYPTDVELQAGTYCKWSWKHEPACNQLKIVDERVTDRLLRLEILFSLGTKVHKTFIQWHLWGTQKSLLQDSRIRSCRSTWSAVLSPRR